jgi:hypothetical protein
MFQDVLDRTSAPVIGVNGAYRLAQTLQPFVGSRDGTTPALAPDLDRALMRIRDSAEGRDYARLIAGALSGKHRPQAQNAWDLAKALRWCLLVWFNGPLALYISQRYTDYVGVVANLPLPILSAHANPLSSFVAALGASPSELNIPFGDHYRLIGQALLDSGDDVRYQSGGGDPLMYAFELSMRRWQCSHAIPDYAPELRMLIKALKEHRIQLEHGESIIARALLQFLDRVAAPSVAGLPPRNYPVLTPRIRFAT